MAVRQEQNFHDPIAARDSPIIVGIISDTHGLLRPEALAALAGCSRIIHAGDLGKAEIFARLNEVAPVVAVRGNVDCGAWADAFPETLTASLGGVGCYVLHDLQTLDFDPAYRNIAVVVSGHSHQPIIQEKTGVVYLNPGSAGPRRFSLPVTVARLKISLTSLHVEIVEILQNTVAQTLTTPLRRTSA